MSTFSVPTSMIDCSRLDKLSCSYFCSISKLADIITKHFDLNKYYLRHTFEKSSV